MTEHDKLVILNTINDSITEIKKLIKAENEAADINTAMIINNVKNGIYKILDLIIKSDVEEKNCKIIWEGYKAVKLVEKGGKIKMRTRKDFIKEIQKEGLSILRLHDKLVKSNINHEFIDRHAEETKRIKDNKRLDIINEYNPFDYQILINENNKEISLIQCFFSYGITQNLIEAYNYDDEPIMLDCDHAAELIINKKLNSYIIASNTVINDINENPEKY